MVAFVNLQHGAVVGVWLLSAIAACGVAGGCGKSSSPSAKVDGAMPDLRVATAGDAADLGDAPGADAKSADAAAADATLETGLADASDGVSEQRLADRAGDGLLDGRGDVPAGPEVVGAETAVAAEVVPLADASDLADARPGVDGGGGLGRVTVVADSVLSSNATTVKSYDTNVNVASYRQHGILFYGGYQFVAWYNGNARNVIVARRSFDLATVSGGTWAWAYVDYTLASGADSHNVVSMGISESDGRLHLAIGQHGDQLYYLRSVANAVSATTWDNTVFGGTGTSDSGAAAPSAGMPNYGAATSDVTYPYFIRPDATTLQLAYRTGSSGDGEMQLAEYRDGAWAYVGQFTSASGSYTQDGVTSTSRNAYPHGLSYDEAGRLHMAFTWREDLNTAFVPNCSDAINNHDTLYLYSDDRGRSWKNNAGSTVADTAAKTSAGVASAGLVVDALPVGRDMMNQETQITDHHNLIHVVVSYIPDPYQPGCATDRTQAQPFHLWRAADGAWSKTQIKLNGQDVNQGYDRSKIFVDASDNAYVLLPDLRLVGATASSQWKDWQLLWDGSSRGNYGEAIIDVNLTRVASGVSILYMKDTSANTGELHVLDLKLGP